MMIKAVMFILWLRRIMLRRSYLYRVKMDGKSKAERLSPADESGTHDYDLSTNGMYASHEFSNINTPPVEDWVSFPKHTVIQPMSGNWCASLSAVSRLSAHHWAAVTSASRAVLEVSEPAALMPAPSVIATIASATSTSISVKPRCARSVTASGRRCRRRRTGRCRRWPASGAGRRGAGRCAVRRSAARGRARRRARRSPAPRCRRSSQCVGSGSLGGQADEAKAAAVGLLARAAPSAPRRPRRAPRRAPIRAATPAAPPRARACDAAGSRRARLATAVAIAMIATTTISSISVKPRGRLRDRTARGAATKPYCQEPMSAFLPSPPATPSAPKL